MSKPVYGKPGYSLLSPIVPNFGCSSTTVPLGAIAHECKNEFQSELSL